MRSFAFFFFSYCEQQGGAVPTGERATASKPHAAVCVVYRRSYPSESCVAVECLFFLLFLSVPVVRASVALGRTGSGSAVSSLGWGLLERASLK